MNNENLGSLLSKHFRPIMLSVGVIIVISIIIIIALIIQNNQPSKTYLTIGVAPSEATILINGQEYHNGSYEFKPGTYEALISADGFTPKTLSLEVKNHETTPFATYLFNEQEGLAYFEKSAADLAILATLSDPEIKEFMNAYNQKITIRDHLPLDATYDLSAQSGTPGNDLYKQTISDGSTDPRCSRAFCLLASGYRLNENALREAVENLGYNFNDYEVINDFET